MQYHIDMSRMDKLIAKLLRFPNTMRFSDVEKVLNAHGYEETRTAGSHHIFTKAGADPVTVPTVGGREVKKGYLKEIAAELDL